MDLHKLTLHLPEEALDTFRALERLIVDNYSTQRGPLNDLWQATEPFMTEADPAEAMKSAADSRWRNWGVRYRNLVWPPKALYFFVQKRLNPGMFETSSDFNTAEALNFFRRLKLELVDLKAHRTS